MTVKHSIPCGGNEVSVRQTDSDKFQVTIQSQVNPLGTGNVLETFSNLDDAIQAAELFCKLHAAAKELGYHLEDGHFVKPDRPKLHVGMLLHEQTMPDELVLLLER
ncbi:hypothetical protein GCM10023310_55750 [Paenibacillus vulneris]|uniref:Uncharacterized protein n=1 Tax=Paenibacillus vulneris TaxID=1133364 RepID=A0ABW3UTC0_9BACL|nr:MULTISPECIES: hypothetical protein [unclassified Paenibacillus]MBE1446207.1 hypothetical protein [Paenibacillus sp. OAS669]